MHPSGQVPDDVWCSIVARRAVARACLHLGVTSTSQEALDTLSEALLAYLGRVAGTLSTAVEASRRSTANVLDVLNVAVPLCTTPAVQRVYCSQHHHQGGGGDASDSAGDAPDHVALMRHGSASDPTQDLSWKGLAAFMFGPDWDRPFTPEEASEAMARYELGGGGVGAGPGGAVGGKVGPSSTADAHPFGGAASSARGWCAPYPDKLPPFPTSKRRSAPSLGLFEEDDVEAEEEEVNEDSGAVPYHWLAPRAAGGGGSKRRRDSDSDDKDVMDVSPSPEDKAPKRVRISDKDPRSLAEGADDGDGDHHHHHEPERLYLPRFLPPFPSHREGVRPVLEASTAPAPATGAASAAALEGADDDDEPGLRVRSALVTLQPDRPLGPRWAAPTTGSSGWEGAPSTTQTPLLSVPWGRPTGGGGTGAASGASAGGAAASSSAAPSPSASAAAQIVPLGRASGSRVSRVLEGSMDGP